MMGQNLHRGFTRKLIWGFAQACVASATGVHEERYFLLAGIASHCGRLEPIADFAGQALCRTGEHAGGDLHDALSTGRRRA
jgi:hypothetical protein